MSEIIVLGIIPGTGLQISFVLWLIIVIGLGVGSLVWLAHRRRIFRNWVITLTLFMLSRNAVAHA